MLNNNFMKKSEFLGKIRRGVMETAKEFVGDITNPVRTMGEIPKAIKRFKYEKKVKERNKRIRKAKKLFDGQTRFNSKYQQESLIEAKKLRKREYDKIRKV